MLNRAASAPGKVIIAGEYVVLDGAPAIVLAVDRRAIVGRSVDAAPPSVASGRLLATVSETLGIEIRGHVGQDTRAFHDVRADTGAAKLGLGSSAALTAALCRLFLPDGMPESALLEKAVSAHRRFQSGAGSGADVAASVAGGLIHYRMEASTAIRHDWPTGLQYEVLWSGRPASTQDKLARFALTGRSRSRSRLADAAEELAAGWTSSVSDVLLPALQRYVDAFEQFDAEHGIGVFAAGHHELLQAAREIGTVYKPSGAGGGDIGIALASDALLLDRFAAVAEGRGFARLRLSADAQGAVLHEDGVK